MRFKTMATITSLIFIVTGAIFFLLSSPITSFLMPRNQKIQMMQDNSLMIDWLKGRFTILVLMYLLGIVLMSCGALIRIVRDVSNSATQVNLSAAFLAMNVFLGALVIKGFGHLHPKFAICFAAAFFVQVIPYGWLLMKRPRASVELSVIATESLQPSLMENWKQQIQEAAAQQERNRLARELHDSVKQQLFSINVNAATAQARWENDETGAKTALNAVRASAREAMAEMEAMLHNLRPAPLETIGLIEALRQQSEALQYRTGANVTAEIGELPTNQEMSPGTQDVIFRIAQETFANVARHARATNVRIRLHRQTGGDEDALWLKIEDDGSGFDIANADGGMGLANIRSRVAEIGGSLQLDSHEGEGTSLTVRVPLVTNESREINRDLRLAVVFACIGFLSSGFGTIFYQPSLWPGAGLPIFLLSGFCCVRAARSINHLKDAGVITPAKILDLTLQLYLSRFIGVAAFMWSLVGWLIVGTYWSTFTRQARYPILLVWVGWQCYEAWHIHRTLKLQRESSSFSDFLRSLNKVWRYASLLLIAAITILRDMVLLSAYALFGYATAILFLYCLFLTGWRWQAERRGRL